MLLQLGNFFRKEPDTVISFACKEADVSDLIDELQVEEQLAEQRDREEDAALDAEGFVDGTTPIDEADAGEKAIESEFGDEPDDDIDVVTQDEGESDKEIEQYAEDWIDIEEWQEVTLEHDQEVFAAFTGSTSAGEDGATTDVNSEGVPDGPAEVAQGMSTFLSKV